MEKDGIFSTRDWSLSWERHFFSYQAFIAFTKWETSHHLFCRICKTKMKFRLWTTKRVKNFFKITKFRAESQKLIQNSLTSRCQTSAISRAPRGTPFFPHLQSFPSRFLYRYLGIFQSRKGRSREGNFLHPAHTATRNLLSLSSSSQFASLPLVFNYHHNFKYFANLQI